MGFPALSLTLFLATRDGWKLGNQPESAAVALRQQANADLDALKSALDFSIATTAIPDITNQLHSSTGYTWIGSAYLLASATSAPVWAKLSDVWGRRAVLLSALGVFTVGSVICALAKTMSMLIAGRSVQGYAAGGMTILVNITISDLFSVRDRGFYLGLTGLIWALSSGIGPSLGGAFAEYVSWRWNWWVNLPVTGLASAILLVFLDVHNDRTGPLQGLKTVDWLGSLCVIGFSAMLLLGLNFGGGIKPWTSPLVLCLIVFGTLLGALFILCEAKFAQHPILPLKHIRNRSNAACLLVCFCHGFVNVASWYYLPLYFQSARLATPLQSGLLIIPITVVQALTAILSGLLLRLLSSPRALLHIGMALTTLGLSLFTTLSPTTPTWRTILFQVLTGIGVGLVFQPPLVALQANCAPEDVATATAAFYLVRGLSTCISIVLGGVLFQTQMGARAARLQHILADPGHNNNNTTAGVSAGSFTGPAALANVGLVAGVPGGPARLAVRLVYAQSLSRMWILYAAVAALGWMASFGVNKGLARDTQVSSEEIALEGGQVL